jgi:hypothetical protein
LERLAARTAYGPVDARADEMVAEELKQLTIRAIAFHKPDVWESCDRLKFLADENFDNIILDIKYSVTIDISGRYSEFPP